MLNWHMLNDHERGIVQHICEESNFIDTENYESWSAAYVAQGNFTIAALTDGSQHLWLGCSKRNITGSWVKDPWGWGLTRTQPDRQNPITGESYALTRAAQAAMRDFRKNGNDMPGVMAAIETSPNLDELGKLNAIADSMESKPRKARKAKAVAHATA